MDIEELKATAELAQLELNEEEVVRLQEEVGRMLENFAKMEELDVADLPPTAHALTHDNPLREDQPDSRVNTEELLNRAPERENEFFIVPNVL
ncbi:MAG: Asp-tRNA(Asn)/Glu-tRNA(Gln) amidotransferase subunit GatC [Spirochaetota bacterium]